MYQYPLKSPRAFVAALMVLVLTLVSPFVAAQDASGDIEILRDLMNRMNGKLSSMERQLGQLTGRLETAEHENGLLREEIEVLRREVAAQSSTDTSAAAPPSPSAIAPADTLAQVGDDMAMQAELTLPEGDAAAQFQYAFDFIRRNDLASGLTAMTLFLDTNPEGELKGNAHFWLGRIHLQQNRPGEAARQFLTVIDEFEGHGKRPDALFELAQVLLTLDGNNGAAACNALAEFQRTADKANPRLKERAQRLAAQAQCD